VICSSISSIYSEPDYACNIAIKTDGSLAAWDYLTDIPAGNDFTAIAMGGYEAYVVRSNGSIIGWGRTSTWTPVPGNNFVDLDAGVYYVVALTAEPITVFLLGLGAVMLRGKRVKKLSKINLRFYKFIL